jgi:two-component system chemotaxis response regulator CheY
MITKILIVDDSPISRRMLKSCIAKDMGYEFHEAGDGLEGLNKYKEVEPDLTFMDLTMPIMDGATSLQEILKFDNEALVIVSTADVQIKSITNVLNIGAFLVLKKPPTKEGILDAMTMAAEHLR